jgi:hypothetical protein
MRAEGIGGTIMTSVRAFNIRTLALAAPALRLIVESGA